MNKNRKKTAVRVLKAFGIALISFAGFALLYFSAAHCLSRIAVNKNAEAGDYITVYILTNGAHTDIVVPIRSDVIDWGSWVKVEDTAGKDPAVDYVAFGWGDKGFYMEIDTWDELTLPIAFRAAFWLSTTAMHVTFYKQATENENCKGIRLSRAQYENLVRYILPRFRRDESGNFIRIETDANYGSNDAFYEATGRYNLFFTCNTWANSALKACGQKAAVWTIFDTGIFHHYRE